MLYFIKLLLILFMLLNALFIYFSFLYGCNVPELSYLTELKLNSDVLTKCPTSYILFYNYFFISISGHISVIILVGVIKRV